MIAVLSSWVKSIVLVVLFASFLELLLPNGSLQRFIRVIMGLFIMLTILNPIVDVIQNHGMEGQLPALSTGSANSSAIVTASHSVVEEREQISNELYKKELSRQIKAVVSAIEGVADAKVQVDIYQRDSNRSGAIKNVVIYVKPGISAGDKKINRIAISKQKTDEIMEIGPQVEAKIKYTLSELYQLSKEQIDVKLLY